MGHPVLRQVARPLDRQEIGTDWFLDLYADMIDTLHDYGGIGLAAPQVGESVRLALIELPGGTGRYGAMPDMPLTAFINPVVEVIDPATAGFWEGCLSVPGLRGFVERPQHIQVSYLDVSGNPKSLELEGFLATVFQHEFDHLDGTLYVDKLTDSRLLSFEREFERYLMPRAEADDDAADEVA